MLEELYNESNIVNAIKSSRLMWAGHVVRMEDNELPEEILWTNPGGQGRGRPKSRWIEGVEEDERKLGCRNWGAGVPRIEIAGDICLRRPRPTQGCRADDYNVDDVSVI